MLAQLLVAPLFLAASAVAHPAVMRRGDVPLSEWSSGNYESYWRFKTRYASLNCAAQNGTDFYTTCCYPLGASQSLSDLPAECTPATLTCDSSTSSTPTPTPDASSTDSYDDESTLPYCQPGDDGYDDDGDDTSTDTSTDASNDTYTDAAYNGGSSSPNTYTPPPTTTTDNSQSQPTDTGNSNTGNNSGSSSNNNNNNNNGSNSGSGSSGGSSSGGSGTTYSGDGTYYYQNGNPGACGNYHSDSDLIGAIDIAWYGNTGAQSQYCGRNVVITNNNNGKSVTIVVADACPTCDSDNSFDLSVGAFSAIADLSDGLIPITWYFA